MYTAPADEHFVAFSDEPENPLAHVPFTLKVGAPKFCFGSMTYPVMSVGVVHVIAAHPSSLYSPPFVSHSVAFGVPA